MALTGRTAAWLNLAYRFARHVAVVMPRRALTADGGLQRFRDAVEAEGYLPLDAGGRALLPAAMNCIGCGLCSLACPAMRDAAAGRPPGAWDEPWTFVAGPSRSIDRAGLVAAGLTPCAACDVCAAVCPTGVPIPQLAALVRRLAEPQPGDES
jgi:formate hydrogenlyase subunit 6/NADH:ubiquinone oxidoreductase subunit I